MMHKHNKQAEANELASQILVSANGGICQTNCNKVA